MKKVENRKDFLTNMLREYLSKIQDDPKVKRLLTPQEAENGLEVVLERIVEEIVKREAELGRRLAFPELQELIIDMLDEISPKETCKNRGAPMNKSSKKEDFKEKVKKLEEALKTEQVKSKEYLSRLKYQQADFENYRKRMEKEVQEATQRSNERLITSFIDIMDDLENAISAGKITENKVALIEGIEMVHKKLNKLLENEGLVKLETIGKPFDPNIHEVLAKIPTKNHQRGIVVEEARKGFIFKGKVLRPSIVKIACEDSDGEEK